MIARIFVFLTLTFSALLNATTIESCSVDQSRCTVSSKRLVITDGVLIVNEFDEIVAKGVVRQMDGQRRIVHIDNRYTDIQVGHKVIRNDLGIEDRYTIFKSNRNELIGGQVGLYRLNIASGSTAFTFDGFYQKYWDHDLNWVVRGQLVLASGEAVSPDSPTGKDDFSTTALQVLGGVSKSFFPRDIFSIRTELGLGLTYVSTSTRNNPPSLDGIKSGFGIASRIGVDLVYNEFSAEWQPMVSAAYGAVKGAYGGYFGVGIMRRF
jgi:hypothetical protein